MTRFNALHRPSLVSIVQSMAKAAQANGGVLYLTRWDIANALKVDAQMVSLALRLAYTSEFLDQYGYGFVPPGNGRSGAIYGYALLHTAVAPTTDALVTLHDGNEKRTDHVRGAAAHFDFMSKAYGRSTPIGRKCRWLARQLDAAVATAEQVQDESVKLLP